MKKNILNIFANAPVREFKDGTRAKGFFQHELTKAGIPKGTVKGLARRGYIRSLPVNIDSEWRTFYVVGDL